MEEVTCSVTGVIITWPSLTLSFHLSKDFRSIIGDHPLGSRYQNLNCLSRLRNYPAQRPHTRFIGLYKKKKKKFLYRQHYIGTSGSRRGLQLSSSLPTYAERAHTAGPDKRCPRFLARDIRAFRSRQDKGYRQILLLHKTMTAHLSLSY